MVSSILWLHCWCQYYWHEKCLEAFGCQKVCPQEAWTIVEGPSRILLLRMQAVQQSKDDLSQYMHCYDS